MNQVDRKTSFPCRHRLKAIRKLKYIRKWERVDSPLSSL